jgi:HD-like signal output (HDOD) protein
MKRILFVDDERNILDGIRRMLHSSRNRWELAFANSGAEALQLCEKLPFDVVISDLRMPEMDGAELLERVQDLYPATARIILSGYSDRLLSARATPVAYRVLNKPCDSTELCHTIENVCALQDVFGDPALRRVVGAIGALPSMSNAYVALNQALRDPSATIASIARIVEQDVAMTAKILQVVNSGFFGFGHNATSLDHAVSYLGLDTIRTLALYSDTFRLFVPDRRIPHSFWQGMQRHSQFTAIVAASLPLTREVRETALVAALLHDIGTLVLASRMPEEFSKVLQTMSDRALTQAQAEEVVLGVTHAEIGAYLLGLWGINQTAVEAIAHHHRPTRVTHSGMDTTVAVYLANLLAHEIDSRPDDPDGECLSEIDRQELEALGLLGQYPELRSRVIAALD